MSLLSIDDFGPQNTPLISILSSHEDILHSNGTAHLAQSESWGVFWTLAYCWVD